MFLLEDNGFNLEDALDPGKPTRHTQKQKFNELMVVGTFVCYFITYQHLQPIIDFVVTWNGINE